MHLLRSTPTIAHKEILEDFNHLMPELQTRQARLPVAVAGLGLHAATDQAAAAYVSSIVASRKLIKEFNYHQIQF